MKYRNLSYNQPKSKNLKKKIKSIREKAYHAVVQDGKVYKGGHTKRRPFENNSLLLFDENENLIREETYNWANNFEQRIDYQYNKHGDLISQHENGFLYQGKHLYKYDADGKQTTITRYDEEGDILTIHTSEYDENGNEIRRFGKAIADYMTDEEEIATYDNDNNLLYVQKTTERYLIIENLENGLVVEMKEFQGETEKKFSSHEKYEYDKNENVITIWSFNADGELRSTQRMLFDEHDNQIKKQHFDENNELTVTWKANLIYDEFGNWVQQLIIREDEPISILEQEIEYYE